MYDKNNELKDENFDASDSLICVMGYVSKLKYGDTEPEVVCVNAVLNDKLITYNYTYKFCNQEFTKSITVEKSEKKERKSKK